MYSSDDEAKDKSNSCLEIVYCPERFSEDIRVEINADREDNCILVLSNQKGRIVCMRGVNVNPGKNQIHVYQVDSLESGLYQLSIKNRNSNIIYRSILTKL